MSGRPFEPGQTAERATKPRDRMAEAERAARRFALTPGEKGALGKRGRLVVPSLPVFSFERKS